MNFLAHIYLSGENDDLLKIGNFMADSIRGKQYLTYSLPIQKGILLHRKIDFFTDSHPIFRQSKKRLVPQFGHYAGVITDIFYDHFLAKNWNLYTDIPLKIYVKNFYQLLENKKELLNKQTQQLVSHMIQDNWLEAYQSVEGISRILYQMDKRTEFQSRMQHATDELFSNTSFFEQEFFDFFDDIHAFVKKELEN